MADSQIIRKAALASMLAIAACAGGGENLAEDPVSLAEVSGPGGASYEDLDPVAAAARSQMAVAVEVIDIEKTHLNTADGRFPSADQLEEMGIGDLTALTDVELAVIEGLAGSVATELDPGDVVTMTVGGGIYQTNLDAQQAEILGVTHVTGATDGETPDVEVETPVSEGAIPISWGSAPGGLVFSEGDHLVIFLVEFTIPGYDTDDLTLLGPIHPNGVLIETDDGWVVQTTSEPVDLEAMLAAVGSETE